MHATLYIIMNKIITIILSLLVLIIIPSCGLDEPENRPGHTRRTVLIYAVASNNLQHDLVSDKAEMVMAAPDVAGLGSDVRVLLYSVPSQKATEATLSELTKSKSGIWEFSDIRTYSRDVFSTDPGRISEVIGDVAELSPSDSYGLVFWSHGTGWIPNFSDHQVPEPSGLKKSYGMDKYGDATDYCDIDELASAIPDDMFDYIWFDLCYMMGIEVAYELRNKCDYVAGYPTEDWSQGMNYESTLPMLAAVKPDLAGAAASFFDYYNSRNMAVTVTVASTSGLERLADAAAALYASGRRPLSPDGMQNYSRLRTGLYDFGQFTKAWGDSDSPEDAVRIDVFEKALDDVVVFAACSEKDFNGRYAFDPEEYSGFSCHFPGSAGVAVEKYYSSCLDWPKATGLH